MASVRRPKIVAAAGVILLSLACAVASPAQRARASQPHQIYPTYPPYNYPTATPYIYPTPVPYPTAALYPTPTFTAVSLPSSTDTATPTSTPTPTATVTPTSTPMSTPTSSPTATPTQTPQPSLTITGASISHNVGGSWQRTATVYQGEAVRFTLTASAANPGSARPTALITISKGSTRIYRGSMSSLSGRSRAFQAQYHFRGPAQLGKLSARFQITLGSASGSRAIQFTVKPKR